jgi:hypothetical protein
MVGDPAIALPPPCDSNGLTTVLGKSSSSLVTAPARTAAAHSADGGATVVRRARPRLQLRLRTLLLGMAISAVIGGHFVNRFYRQQRAVQMVTRHGGQIVYRRADTTAGHGGRWFRPPRNVGWLLRDVEEVTLFFAAVEDKELGALRHCSGLKRLNLDYTSIGDRGLAELVDLPRLEWLDLKGTLVTDAGVASIVRLPRLESLILDGLDLSDEGLRQLHDTTSLRYVSVRNTHVSQLGLDRFQQAHPQCLIVR